MHIDVKLEGLLNQATQATVTKIHQQLGNLVKVGDALVDVEAGKGTTSIHAQVAGKVTAIPVQVGETIAVGTTVAVLTSDEPPVSTSSVASYFGSFMQPRQEQLETEVVILGGGPGGYVAAIYAAQRGLKVVLVEKERVGGTCLNKGCIPTKALVRSAAVYRDIKQADHYGLKVEQVSVEMGKVIERKNQVVANLVQGVQHLLTQHNVTIVQGTGVLQDPQTVVVNGNNSEVTIKAVKVIIATGSKPIRLADNGLEAVIDSEQLLSLTEVPSRLVIVGGGYIGMEFAFIYAAFGAQVTVIQSTGRCLPSLDADISDEIARSAMEKGIQLITSARVEEFLPSVDGSCIVAFSHPEGRSYVVADKVLIAIGREPNLEGVNLEGLEQLPSGRGIKVNEHMQTNLPNVYAIGDVTNLVQLAHVASHQGLVAVKHILGEQVRIDYTAVPSAIFTEPEVGSVGLTEREAREKGLKVNVGRFPLVASGKAVATGHTAGFVKLIAEDVSGVILGGAIVGTGATDLLGELTLAVTQRLTAAQLIETIHAHPTMAEAIHEAALDLEGGALHFVRK